MTDWVLPSWKRPSCILNCFSLSLFQRTEQRKKIVGGQRVKITNQTHDNIIYKILGYLEQTGNVPSGAGSVRRFLNGNGIMLADATVGRILRDMDCSGYTLKCGKQGRILSDCGRQKYRELDEALWRDKWTGEFMDTPEKVGREYLLNLLEARLPVETAVAKTAAKTASAEEIEALRKIVDEQEKLAKSGAAVSPLDTEFHMTLAAASHNQILEAIVTLLRKKEEYARAFEHIRRATGDIYNQEHRNIFNAVAARDPEMAELAMKRHINNLIENVLR